MFCLSDRLSVDDLGEVQRKLFAVRNEWYNLGLELGQRAATLDSIDAKYNSDPSQCFRQVLKEWLKGVNPPPTWQAMVNALKSPTVEQSHLAEKIQTELPPALTVPPLAQQPLSPKSLSPQSQSPHPPSTSALPHPKPTGRYRKVKVPECACIQNWPRPYVYSYPNPSPYFLPDQLRSLHALSSLVWPDPPVAQI